jgi:hypothetical protein
MDTIYIYKIPILGDSFNLLDWQGKPNLIPDAKIDIENLKKNYKEDSLHASPFEGYYYYVTNKSNNELKDFLYENPQNPQNSVCTISFKDKKSKKKSKVKKSKDKVKKSKDKVKKTKKDK